MVKVDTVFFLIMITNVVLHLHCLNCVHTYLLDKVIICSFLLFYTFFCYSSSYCVGSDVICDGIFDCPGGEDEKLPLCISSNNISAYNDDKFADSDTFKCRSGNKIIPNSEACNGRSECRDGCVRNF